MKIMLYDTGVGLLPFLKSILKKKKYNEYYLYMDEDVFPLGTKSKDFIINHLTHILSYADKHFDLLIIACNTMSSYLSILDLSKYNIKILSIFEENLKELDEDTTILATEATLRNTNHPHKLDGSPLPKLIEDNNIKEIIKFVSNLNITTKKVILGCTHFPLIKFIFEDLYKDKVFISMEDKLIDKLPNSGYIKVNGNKKAKLYLERYLNLSNKILC